MAISKKVIMAFCVVVLACVSGCGHMVPKEFKISCRHNTLIAMAVVGERYRVQAVLGRTIRTDTLHSMLKAEIGVKWVYFSLVNGAIERVYPVEIVDEKILDVDEYLTLVKQIMIYKRKEYVVDQANKQFNGGQ